MSTKALIASLLILPWMGSGFSIAARQSHLPLPVISPPLCHIKHDEPTSCYNKHELSFSLRRRHYRWTRQVPLMRTWPLWEEGRQEGLLSAIMLAQKYPEKSIQVFDRLKPPPSPSDEAKNMSAILAALVGTAAAIIFVQKAAFFFLPGLAPADVVGKLQSKVTNNDSFVTPLGFKDKKRDQGGNKE